MDFRETGKDKTPSNTQANPVLRMVAGVSLLLLFFVTLTLSANLQKSPTADEPFHLVAGYSYLRWGDYRINPEHPPFAKVLAALPLLALNINDAALSRDERDIVQTNRMYGWLLANRWLFAGNDAEKIFFYAKLPMIVLGVSLGILVFCWARELYGSVAGFAALGLYSLDPNIIAHTPIVHTDIPLTLFSFAGTYFFWRTLKQVTWLNWLLSALFLALTIITKFSGFAVLCIWGLLGIIRIFSTEPIKVHVFDLVFLSKHRQKTCCISALLFSAGLLGYVTIWAAYGFRYDAVTAQQGALAVGSFAEQSQSLASIVRLNAEYHLLPEAWLTGVHYAYLEGTRSAYLLGEVSDHGFWIYFPIAFAVKTPLPTIILLLVSLVIFSSKDKRCSDGSFMLIPILLFFSFAVISRMNIGLRHLLPIYPFLFVWIGGNVATLFAQRSIGKRFILLLLGLWLVLSCLIAYPNYLAYFNETIRPQIAHEILVDSNLDWGQDLKGLKRWMDKNDVKKIHLAYFGTADPAYYGIKAVYKAGTWATVMSPSAENDESGVPLYIAISATHLAGVYLRPSNIYARFRSREPVTVIGNSIRVYKIMD